jgi:hypothetical protein
MLMSYNHIDLRVLFILVVNCFFSRWYGGGEMVLSKNMRSGSSNIEPKMTSDGKYQCEADNRVFNTREEYDMHCNQAHSRSSEKGW